MSRPATSRLKVNPPVGSLPVLQYCSPDQLQIDADYQRSLDAGPSQSLIRRIAMFWDWGLCQPLIVARRADGGLYVVDGQHRLAAAKLRDDIWQLPCVIASYRDAAGEAAAFVSLNQERRPLGALEIFKASVAAGDASSMAVADMLRRSGLSLAAHSNYTAWTPGQVSNIGGILACFRQLGAERTRAALTILAKAFAGQILRYSGTIFPGIVGVLSGKIQVAPEDVIATLSGRSQADWRRDILNHRAEFPNEKFQVAAGAVIAAALRAPAPPEPVSVAIPERRSPAIIPVDDVNKRWCEQCDKRVSSESARFCVSRFCSLRKSA